MNIHSRIFLTTKYYNMCESVFQIMQEKILIKDISYQQVLPQNTIHIYHKTRSDIYRRHFLYSIATTHEYTF